MLRWFLHFYVNGSVPEYEFDDLKYLLIIYLILTNRISSSPISFTIFFGKTNGLFDGYFKIMNFIDMCWQIVELNIFN